MIDVDAIVRRLHDEEQAAVARAEERARKLKERVEEFSQRRTNFLKHRLERLRACLMEEAPPVRLHFWFKHDTWSPYEGLVILCGYDPSPLQFESNGEITPSVIRGPFYDFVQLNDLRLDDMDLHHAIGEFEVKKLLDDFLSRYRVLLRVWNSGEHPAERYSPQYFVDWAEKKKILCSWLNWAEQQEYVQRGKGSESNEITGKSQTAYLNIIGALCDLYWREKYQDGRNINQSEVISALLDSYTGFSGISETNLKKQLSKAIAAIRPR